MQRTLAGLLVLAPAVFVGCVSPDEPTSAEAKATPGEAPAKGDDEPARVPAVVAPDRLALHAPKVGYTLETLSTAQETGAEGERALSSRVSVVGETNEAWHVELEGPAFPGFVMGLLVAKEDLRVTRAFLGRPGEVGQTLNIAELAPANAVGGGTPGEVNLAIGSFACVKHVEGATTTWIGTEGELEGVLLKYDDSNGGPYELEDMPATSEVQVSGETLTVTRFAYTNGSERWTTKHEVVVALNGGVFKNVVQAVTQLDVTEIGTDRQPQLRWD